MRTVDVCHLEDTQAALTRINSLVDLLREYVEPHASEQSTYRHEFETLTLNLHNLHELVYQLNAEVERHIHTAYNRT